jgi:hypothetical protein
MVASNSASLKKFLSAKRSETVEKTMAKTGISGSSDV